MPITPKALYTGGRLGTTASVLYTCLPNTRAVVTQAVFTNTDTANQTFSVYLVRAGAGAPGPTNILIDAQVLASTQAYVSQELAGQNLAAGDTIQALASATNVITCSGISGYELS